jgi:hypothetical protein
MRKIFFFLLITSVWSVSCTDTLKEPTGTLEIIFKARYNSHPLILFQSDSSGQNDPLTLMFKKLDFFISDIKGNTGSGTLTDFTDVGYISMSSSLDSASSEQGTSYIINDIPVGSFDRLDLGVGLSDAVNSTVPGSYSSSSPLGLNSNYWESWNSYILCKLEGDINQSNSTTTGFLYHAGVNGMHQQRSFNHSFDISESETTSITIYLQAEELFFRAGSEIDMINDNQTHSGTIGSTEYNLAKTAIENLANSLYVQ